MKVSDNKKHLLESVMKKREATLSPIIKDVVVFKTILKDRKSRVMIYNRMREEVGPMGASYKDTTFKKYFLYPTNPIIGIPESDQLDVIVKIMEYVIAEVLMIRLNEMKAECKCLSGKIDVIKKYIPEYEKSIKKTA
jgi:hypothetical protein